MQSVNKHRQWIPRIVTLAVLRVSLCREWLRTVVTLAVLRVALFRQWLPEIVIVVAMLVLLLLDLGLRFTPGRHTVAHVVVWGLLFGLIALWVYVNPAALAAWEQEEAEERDRQGD